MFALLIQRDQNTAPTEDDDDDVADADDDTAAADDDDDDYIVHIYILSHILIKTPQGAAHPGDGRSTPPPRHFLQWDSENLEMQHNSLQTNCNVFYNTLLQLRTGLQCNCL